MRGALSSIAVQNVDTSLLALSYSLDIEMLTIPTE